MGLKGEIQYLNVFISDLGYTVDDGITMDELYTALNADASTIFFDSRLDTGITMKAGVVLNIEQGETVMNRGVAPDKVTFEFIALGLDDLASQAKNTLVKNLQGQSKNVYFVDPDSGLITRVVNIPIMLKRKYESNTKTEYTISADREVTTENATVNLV